MGAMGPASANITVTATAAIPRQPLRQRRAAFRWAGVRSALACAIAASGISSPSLNAFPRVLADPAG